MTLGEERVIARIAQAGAATPIGTIDLSKVTLLARQRRRRRIAVLGSMGAIVLIVTGILHQSEGPSGAPNAAAKPTSTHASRTDALAPNNCSGPDVFVSPSGDLSVTAGMSQPLSFEVTESDTNKGVLIRGSLVLSKPGTGYDDPQPVDETGVPRFTLPENQISLLKVVPISGRFSDSLNVDSLAPGVYPVTFIETFNPGVDCNGPNTPRTVIFTVATVVAK